MPDLRAALGHLHDSATELWCHCGGAALTGDSDGPPLVPSAPAAAVMAAAGDVLGVPDAPALLGERAALAGLARRGKVSCGGAARLLHAADGWVVVSLPREDDWALLDAWIGVSERAWDAVARAVADRPAEELEAGARLLGLAAAAVVERAGPVSPWTSSLIASSPALARPPVVVDLSTLWAGPLCAGLLWRAGATVVKVEDPRRPDAARRGNPVFFDILNGGKQRRSVRLDDPELVTLLRSADVIVTSARQRSFDQAGIDPFGLLRESPTVWLAITADGWASDRIGFGDDCAAGAGLVAWDPSDGQPRFAADAIADPLCGTLATVAVTEALAAGGSWFVDAPLRSAAGFVAGMGSGQATAAIFADAPRSRSGVD